MNSEQEKELLLYLERAGFTGEQLKRDIVENISRNQPSFIVRHRIEFAEEAVLFDLHFIRDAQFNAYKLEKYRAIYREDIKIAHKTVDGIDTAMLEERMKPHDWEAYFAGRASLDQKKEMDPIAADLNRLRQSDTELYRELLIKNCPDYYFQDLRENMSIRYEAVRDFHVNEQGLCNADLAFYIVSDRLDNLYEDLSRLRLEDVIKTDLYNDLSDRLSRNPDDFELKYSINTSDGLYELLIPFKKENGWHGADHYHIEMTPHPEIAHGVFKGVDSRELEGLMKEINWNRDKELFTFHESAEPKSNPKVEEVEERMFRLALDPDGAHIADQLQTKYWPGVTFFADIIRESAWQKFDAIPKRAQEFPINVPVKNAMNLLAGRTVLDFPVHLVPKREDKEWIRLDLAKKEEGGTYSVIKIEGMSIRDVDSHLGLLPVSSQDYYPLRASLLRGDLSPVTFSNGIKVLLEANPEQKTLNIFSPDRKVIPFNFRFDPDWKPEQNQSHGIAPGQEKPKQKSTHPKLAKPKKNIPKKGRGI